MPLNVHDADIAALAAAIPDPEDQQAMTTPTDLAHRVALLPGFRWMPGMRAVNIPRRLLLDDEDDSGRVGDDTSADALVCRGVPDLTDPATGGCLYVALGRWANRIRSRVRGGYEWSYYADNMTFGALPEWRHVQHLAEACARVALSLGRWPGGAK